MTHQSGHVILSFTTPLNSAKPKYKVWHAAAAVFAFGFILGALFF